MNDQYVKSQFCMKCRIAKGHSDQLGVLELYGAGWTLREIDAYLGRPPHSASAILRELRLQGVEVPYRRPPKQQAA
jgi:hypothetical protein